MGLREGGAKSIGHAGDNSFEMFHNHEVFGYCKTITRLYMNTCASIGNRHSTKYPEWPISNEVCGELKWNGPLKIYPWPSQSVMASHLHTFETRFPSEMIIELYHFWCNAFLHGSNRPNEMLLPYLQTRWTWDTSYRLPTCGWHTLIINLQTAHWYRPPLLATLLPGILPPLLLQSILPSGKTMGVGYLCNCDDQCLILIT